MEQLGYYAMDKNKDLFQFEWDEVDNFYILKDGKKIVSDPNNYEILEIGFFTADDYSKE